VCARVPHTAYTHARTRARAHARTHNDRRASLTHRVAWKAIEVGRQKANAQQRPRQPGGSAEREWQLEARLRPIHLCGTGPCGPYTYGGRVGQCNSELFRVIGVLCCNGTCGGAAGLVACLLFIGTAAAHTNARAVTHAQTSRARRSNNMPVETAVSAMRSSGTSSIQCRSDRPGRPSHTRPTPV
jgi:hypothetical protein